jgi:tRNA dimethylallyltransferase
VGKSEVAILLAEKFGAEIISVDSMLVYRGMDIGTAKPSRQDQARIPHHLIDVADLSETFDAARFVRLAREAELRVVARGRRPLYCGGTGLYFKVLIHGLGENSTSNPAIRAELEQTPLEKLLPELAERDPATFAAIDRQNHRRVIRALEVIRVSGRPYSEIKARWQTQTNDATVARIIGLRRTQHDLQARINTRVDAMFQAGLVAEVQQLLSRGLASNRTALQALGYRQVVEHLQGQRSLPETVELVKSRTRQFAKRQMTWFKIQTPLDWVDIQADTAPASIATQIQKTETFKRLDWEK